MGDSTSPLQAINQKELDLRRRLEAAQLQAESLRQAARTEAAQLIDQADREARVEAEALYQQGIEQARQEAEALVAKGDMQASALRRRAMAELDKAAHKIVELVLPKNLGCPDEMQTELTNVSEQVRSR